MNNGGDLKIFHVDSMELNAFHSTRIFLGTVCLIKKYAQRAKNWWIVMRHDAHLYILQKKAQKMFSWNFHDWIVLGIQIYVWYTATKTTIECMYKELAKLIFPTSIK